METYQRCLVRGQISPDPICGVCLDVEGSVCEGYFAAASGLGELAMEPGRLDFRDHRGIVVWKRSLEVSKRCCCGQLCDVLELSSFAAWNKGLALELASIDSGSSVGHGIPPLCFYHAVIIVCESLHEANCFKASCAAI